MKSSRESKGIKKKKNWKRILVIVIGIVILCVLALGIVFLIMRAIGKNELQEVTAGEIPIVETTEEVENWQNGWVRHNGQIYAYNEDMMTFLVMGIDNDDEVKQAEDGLSGGQADAMFLVAMNPHDKSISIIAVNRNTMAMVDVYDADGVYMGQYTKQITLQHGYGDGLELSCERSVAAVSRLFYNLPISGYAAINMGIIPELNNAVGGVEVDVLDDVVYPEFDMDLHKGDHVILNGHQAYWYVRGRYEHVFNSSSLRLERQKQYLSNFVVQAKSKAINDVTVAFDLYNIAQKYMVTDIDMTEFTYLVSEVLGYSFNTDKIYSMQGETIMGENFEEFYADDEALYQMVIDVFYEAVEQPKTEN